MCNLSRSLTEKEISVKSALASSEWTELTDMNNGTHQAVPTRFTEAKSTSLVREVFTSNFWMSGLAMLKYIPRSFGVKQVDGMAFLTESKHDEFRNRVLRITPANPRQW